MNVNAYRVVAGSLGRSIEEQFDRVGLMCRVFHRGKGIASLQKKLAGGGDKYGVGKKLIQDVVGIRVVLYFPEDLLIADRLLRHRYECDDQSSTIDRPSSSQFTVSRHNLIFRLPIEHHRDIPPASLVAPVDQTFEVQIRTILSEGWHEIEHDLRYKRKPDWTGHDDLSRGLNGVVATLETAEWSMRKIFDDLAYKHYKNQNWGGMLHSSLRIRMKGELSESVASRITANPALAKGLIRVNRPSFIGALDKVATEVPLNIDNMVYLWNWKNRCDDELTRVTPKALLDIFESSLAVSG